MLSLSQTAGYAILALSCLDPTCKRRVLAREIADKTGISRPYLTKILHRLGQTGLVDGKRGYRGGIALTRPAKRISVLEVSEAVDGDTWKERCLLGMPRCGDSHTCPLHEGWTKERKRIEKALARLTLDTVAQYRKAGWKVQKQSRIGVDNHGDAGTA